MRTLVTLFLHIKPLLEQERRKFLSTLRGHDGGPEREEQFKEAQVMATTYAPPAGQRLKKSFG
jgi:hypothetical protein